MILGDNPPLGQSPVDWCGLCAILGFVGIVAAVSIQTWLEKRRNKP